MRFSQKYFQSALTSSDYLTVAKYLKETFTVLLKFTQVKPSESFHVYVLLLVLYVTIAENFSCILKLTKILSLKSSYVYNHSYIHM